MPPKTSTRKRSFNFYKRTARTNGLVKRAKGNLFASKKQNDICDFTITFNHTFPVTSYVNPTTGAVASGYAMNIWDLLSKAPNFKAFQGMYDQVRINGVQVKLQTANSTLDTANNNQIYNVYTAWDIDGMDKSLVQPITSVNGDDTHNIVGFLSNLGNAIATYGSASKMQLNPYQRWSQNRSIYPSTMQEKTQFVSTDSIVDYHENYNITTHRFDFKGTYATAGLNVQSNQVQAVFDEIMNQDNPAILTTNQKYPFKPTLYVDAFSSNTNVTTNLIDPYIPVAPDNKIVFSAEIKVACTFRGLKGTANVQDVQAQKHVTITENNHYLILPDEPCDAMRSVDLTVNVPQPEIPVIEEDKYQYIESNGPLVISPTNGYDAMEKVSLVVNVPSNNEILTNKRIQRTGTITISDLMNSPLTKDGISKNSTLIIDVPIYDITQISNYPITQNGTQIIPIPSGYDAVDSISLNVNVNIPNEWKLMNNSSLGNNCVLVKGDSSIVDSIIIDCNNLTNTQYGLYKVYGNTTFKTISEIKNYNSSTSFAYFFRGCSSLESVPYFEFGGAIIQALFYGCTSLKTIPEFNTTGYTNMTNLFYGCNNLSTASLRNILKMCIKSNVSASNKKLNSYVGVDSSYNSTIQSLYNYSSFISAGWSLT